MGSICQCNQYNLERRWCVCYHLLGTSGGDSDNSVGRLHEAWKQFWDQTVLWLAWQESLAAGERQGFGASPWEARSKTDKLNLAWNEQKLNLSLLGFLKPLNSEPRVEHKKMYGLRFHPILRPIGWFHWSWQQCRIDDLKWNIQMVFFGLFIYHRLLNRGSPLLLALVWSRCDTHEDVFLIDSSLFTTTLHASLVQSSSKCMSFRKKCSEDRLGHTCHS